MVAEFSDLIRDKGFVLKVASCVLALLGMVAIEANDVSIESFGTTGVGASHYEGLCFHTHFVILAMIIVSYVVEEKSEVVNKAFCLCGGAFHLALSVLYLKTLLDLTWTGSHHIYINTCLCGVTALLISVLLITDAILAILNKWTLASLSLSTWPSHHIYINTRLCRVTALLISVLLITDAVLAILNKWTLASLSLSTWPYHHNYINTCLCGVTALLISVLLITDAILAILNK